jgi:hypothetical protein
MRPEREVAVTRADRERVLAARAIGPSRAVVEMLVAAVALLAAAVAGPVAHFSPVQLESPAHLTVAAHLGDGASSVAVLTPASRQPAQAPWFGSAPGTAADLLLTAALLASLLLALVRVPLVPSQARRALPRRRGPPRLAFTD